MISTYSRSDSSLPRQPLNVQSGSGLPAGKESTDWSISHWKAKTYYYSILMYSRIHLLVHTFGTILSNANSILVPKGNIQRGMAPNRLPTELNDTKISQIVRLRKRETQCTHFMASLRSFHGYICHTGDCAQILSQAMSKKTRRPSCSTEVPQDKWILSLSLP